MTLNTEVKPLQNGLKIQICLFEWPSQSPDLYPIKIMRNDLRRAVHTRHPKNILETEAVL